MKHEKRKNKNSHVLAYLTSSHFEVKRSLIPAGRGSYLDLHPVAHVDCDLVGAVRLRVGRGRGLWQSLDNALGSSQVHVAARCTEGDVARVGSRIGQQ